MKPAQAADRAVRDAFFESLKDVANRRREPWVLEAVGYLHHPPRALLGGAIHSSSLAVLLEQIQRTGDIFFPKRWMDATSSGQRSAAASRMVSGFVTRFRQTTRTGCGA